MDSEVFDHLTVLTTGDCDWAGHSKTSVHLIWTNLTKSQLRDAYEQSAKKHGLYLSDECDQNNYLSLPFVKRLEALDICGELVKDHLQYYAYDNPVLEAYYDGIDCDDFAILYLEIARLHEPKLEWRFVPANYIELYGYGLFSS